MTGLRNVTLWAVAALAGASSRPAAPGHSPAHAQADSSLLKRWVGTYKGNVLNFEFYGDTMLVVNDKLGLSVRITEDSIVAKATVPTGDTTVAGRYRLAVGHLLFEGADGIVVTMSAQTPLARPIGGRWLGELGMGDRPAAELMVDRVENTAAWRKVGDQKWIRGEFERSTRTVTFTWADNTEWTGQYDPIANTILFEQTVPESSASVFRRTFR